MKVKITKSENCIYLTQDISDLTEYQKAKAIRNFINNETLVLENAIDTEIRAIFGRNGIKIVETDNNSLEIAFAWLNCKGKRIVMNDIYENCDLERCVVVGTSKNGMCVVLEEEKVLQAGIEIYEKEIK